MFPAITMVVLADKLSHQVIEQTLSLQNIEVLRKWLSFQHVSISALQELL